MGYTIKSLFRLFHRHLLPFRSISLGLLILAGAASAAVTDPKYHVLVFCPNSGDSGHDSYMREFKKWFPGVAEKLQFQFDTTKNWSDCNYAKLSKYQVVMFLDNRPEGATQRADFQKYMQNGGGWIGCHFAAFAMNASGVKQDWDWYHKEFLGSGEYRSNIWPPWPATLKIEEPNSVYTQGIPHLVKVSANEWYRWQPVNGQDWWKGKSDIKIIASIDSSSYPLGSKVETDEVWRSGYYPAVWTNVKYKMLYLNMGHNLLDYANGNKDLSQTFASEEQNKFIYNALTSFGEGTSRVIKPMHSLLSAKPRDADEFTFGISIFNSQGRQLKARPSIPDGK